MAEGEVGACRSNNTSSRAPELPLGAVKHHMVEEDIEVEEGRVTTGIEIETSEATALEENGFELVEENGELLVSFVDPDGPAMLGGLEAGDVVEAVQVGGLDLDVLEGGDSRLTRLLLGHWDGPGITLVVDRDGQEVEVPLEW